MTWWYFIQPIPLSRQLDYVSGQSPIYIGEAVPGANVAQASWRIQKLTYDGNGNVTQIQWSSKYATFGDIWNNRATTVSYI